MPRTPSRSRRRPTLASASAHAAGAGAPPAARLGWRPDDGDRAARPAARAPAPPDERRPGDRSDNARTPRDASASADRRPARPPARSRPGGDTISWPASLDGDAQGLARVVQPPAQRARAHAQRGRRLRATQLLHLAQQIGRTQIVGKLDQRLRQSPDELLPLDEVVGARAALLGALGPDGQERTPPPLAAQVMAADVDG